MVVFDPNFFGLADDGELVAAEIVAERRALRLRNFEYAWKACNVLSQVLQKSRCTAFIIVLPAKIQKRRGNALYFKAGVDRLRVVERPHEQSRRQ